MSIIETRLAKLERITRDRHIATRLPGVCEEDWQHVRQVATVCNSPAELETYLQSLLPASGDQVVSMEEKRRTAAVMGSLARTMFEEART